MIGRRTFLFLLANIFATAMLAGAYAAPAEAAAGWFDCCECTTEGFAFCCKDCCFITRDCPDGSADCAQSACQET